MSMNIYELTIRLKELNGGGDHEYMATSPDLPGLIVVGDTPDEVIDLAPQVDSALIASLKDSGDKIPETLQPITRLPHISRLTITVPA
jgi:predicted RNase H-like HicB family nuclease